jgi:hypothetical protein
MTRYLSVEPMPSTLPVETTRWGHLSVGNSPPGGFHNLLWVFLQQPRGGGNSTPPGLLSLIQPNVRLPMSDPEQASKLPVCSGLTDTSLKSLPSKGSFCKTLFFIVQKSRIHTTW